MFRHIGWVLTLGLVAAPAFADGERKLTVVPSKALPAVEAVAVYPTGARPGKEKPAASATKPGEPVVLPGEGPFDVWVTPKGGLAVRAAEKLTVKAGQTHELKLADVLGVVEVFGDNLPRANKLILTAPDDPGPGEKGHAPVQVAADYRIGMAVPEGVYAVWVVPANGARPRKVEDRVRVHAGRTTRVGDESPRPARDGVHYR
jgi:hypothetical protein